MNKINYNFSILVLIYNELFKRIKFLESTSPPITRYVDSDKEEMDALEWALIQLGIKYDLSFVPLKWRGEDE